MKNAASFADRWRHELEPDRDWPIRRPGKSRQSKRRGIPMEWSSKSWDAWCEHPPGDEPPVLHVMGECEAPPGFEFSLTRAEREAEPQPELVLSLVVLEPQETRPDLFRYTVSYREPGCGFDTVTIQHAAGHLASVKVGQEP